MPTPSPSSSIRLASKLRRHRSPSLLRFLFCFCQKEVDEEANSDRIKQIWDQHRRHRNDDASPRPNIPNAIITQSRDKASSPIFEPNDFVASRQSTSTPKNVKFAEWRKQSSKSVDQIDAKDSNLNRKNPRKLSVDAFETIQRDHLGRKRDKMREKLEKMRKMVLRRHSTVVSERGGGAREPMRAEELIGLEGTKGTETFDALLRWTLLQVSVDTMAITALPLDCWLKERLKNWVQLSGHKGTIVPASNHTLWKKQPPGSQAEARAYAKITKDPILRGITPKFYKEIAHKQEMFIEIQDLLAQFPNTQTRAIMDIKIGTRTFLESEVTNKKKREDLYQKMVELAPEEPTEEEREEAKITKLRYMQFRERESSSASLGFRIEAAQMPGGILQKNFKKVRSRANVRETLDEFLNGHDELKPQLAERLKQIREAVERSEFFRVHELVGSSVLVIYDQRKIGAWLIDFAKSNEVEEGKTLTHRTPWKLGNHEDGYLIGLDNLIGVLDSVSNEENGGKGR